jgi:hypothetical protein
LLAEMPVKRRTGNLSAEFLEQDPINDLIAASRLFAFELDGSFQQLGPLAWLITIPAGPAEHSLHPLFAQLLPPPAQGPRRNPAPLTIGQEVFLLAELLEIGFPLARRNLFQQHRAE